MANLKFPRSGRFVPFGVLNNESDKSKELGEYDGINDIEDIDDIEELDESLSVYEAAEIWASHGKDEDYMFGYTEEELEDAL
ncbi:hypothetical protein F7984_02100 [Pradoshia sp. D12]|uniref:hypothetical protein n=1 Tax=Bacillaceae TaxID=186817 RepID=UPI00080AD959|nr:MULTISPECIES: hypothetical protein [Bacillaceae]OCA82652.1 hypothetical protein A8L44_13785 [Bacillus sp. FJAT-27986]QFK70138.1 hypothetical protein F7984_02100 [Pradoshia sp. D12]TPF70918.1 hypothetical protein FHY44_14275 [Bacillus sp. D12]